MSATEDRVQTYKTYCDPLNLKFWQVLYCEDYVDQCYDQNATTPNTGASSYKLAAENSEKNNLCFEDCLASAKSFTLSDGVPRVFKRKSMIEKRHGNRVETEPKKYEVHFCDTNHFVTSRFGSPSWILWNLTESLEICIDNKLFDSTYDYIKDSLTQKLLERILFGYCRTFPSVSFTYKPDVYTEDSLFTSMSVPKYRVSFLVSKKRSETCVHGFLSWDTIECPSSGEKFECR